MSLYRNMVGSGRLGNKIVLQDVVNKTNKRAEMRKNCLLLKLTNPKSSAMLFPSGKVQSSSHDTDAHAMEVVCTGQSTEEGLKAAAQKVAQLLKHIDFHVSLSDFQLENVIGRADAGFRILVEELALRYPDVTTPELYPALVFRMSKPKVHILIFARYTFSPIYVLGLIRRMLVCSGKIVFTGSKESRHLREACDNISTVDHVFNGRAMTNGRPQILNEFRDLKPQVEDAASASSS
ncbi:hypothetical protein DYB32_001825 [Aphanomyces invadans]|uniref:Uncharacterized protein n=1 Tax=Aphanomyces invadans TaxID=157072 RepID=A0A3R6VFC8_9STRA|nr:hypothetical protein DYB32_001825 [Aphanomyces invadans]